MKRRLTVLALIVLMLLSTLGGCTQQATPAATTQENAAAAATEAAATEEPAATPFKIGYVMLEDTGNSYNIMVAMEKSCKERGYDFLYESASNDNEKTVSITQNFITKGCNAIFVYTVDAGTMATVKSLCDNAGVHVAFTGLMEENYIQICDNEFAQGEAGAEAAIAAATNKWGADAQIDLIIVTEATEVGDGNRIRMHEAFVPRLLKEYPYYAEADVMWVDCGLDLLKASSEISNYLSAHPDAQHIIVPVFYNASGGQGAMNALIAAGREDQAIVVSYHISDAVTVDYLKNSSKTWVGSFYFPPESYVDPLFTVAMDPWANGEEVDNQFIYSDYVFVNADNIGQYEPFPFQQ